MRYDRHKLPLEPGHPRMYKRLVCHYIGDVYQELCRKVIRAVQNEVMISNDIQDIMQNAI